MAKGFGSDPVTALQGDNDVYLDQLMRFLERINTGDYRAANGADAAIGTHVRHVLEHYETLLRKADLPINYDRRTRDLAVEQCPQTGIASLQAVRAQLHDLADMASEQTLTVACSCATDGSERPTVVTSTLGRELMFLQSHTVHHLALIAVLARQRGMSVPTDFGVAPATLQYRASTAPPEGSCAR